MVTRSLRITTIPWPTGKSFAKAHNKKLSGKAATTAAKQATAMINKSVPEGIAIATANKTGNRLAARGKKSKGLINSA